MSFRLIKHYAFFALLVASCGREAPTISPTPSPISDQTLMERSWLTGHPCQAPCWYGLELGVSARDEVLDRARSLTFLSDEDFIGLDQYYGMPGSNDAVPSKLVWLDCVEPPDAPCATAVFVEDVLVEITVHPNYRILFEEAVDLLGSPDFVALTTVTPEISDCFVSIIWSSKQLRISYNEKASDTDRYLCDLVKEDNGRLPPNLPVQDVLYALPGWLDDYMDGVLIWPWSGFADF